jgi:hypothetical protein
VKDKIISEAKLAARKQFLKMMSLGEAVIANYELPLRPELLYNSRIYGHDAFSTIKDNEQAIGLVVTHVKHVPSKEDKELSNDGKTKVMS